MGVWLISFLIGMVVSSAITLLIHALLNIVANHREKKMLPEYRRAAKEINELLGRKNDLPPNPDL
jgi:hypothetical protein